MESEVTVYLCMICHFEVILDDVMIKGTHGRVVCIRCYRRETESEEPMSKELRRELSATLKALE